MPRSSRLVLAVLSALMVLASWPALAQNPECAFEELTSEVAECGGTAGKPSQKPGKDGDIGAAVPQRDPNAPFTQRVLAPTCSGNTRTALDVMCDGAIVNCEYTAGAAEGSIAYWLWTRTYRPGIPEEQQEDWARQPGFVCLGGDEAPEAPTVAQVAAVVQRDFQQLVVISGTTTVTPGTKTLINVDTIFSTDRTGPEALPPITILGHGVVITVKPEAYTWHFGDRATLTTTTPGRPGEKDVTHTYTRPGDYEPYVVIEWSGTFSIDGGTPLTVRGRAQTTGPTAAITAASARSELVRD